MRYANILFAVITLLVFWVFASVITGCSDGWGSPSIGSSGACSHHGGVSPISSFVRVVGFFASIFVFFYFSRSGDSEVDSRSGDSEVDSRSGDSEVDSRVEVKPNFNDNVQNKKKVIASKESKIVRELVFSIESIENKKTKKFFFYSDGLLISEVYISKSPSVSTKRISKSQLLKIKSVINDGVLSGSYSSTVGERKGYNVGLFKNNARERSDYFFHGNKNQTFIDIKGFLNSIQ